MRSGPGAGGATYPMQIHTHLTSLMSSAASLGQWHWRFSACSA